MATNDEILDFKARGPVPIFLEDERADYRSGCSILDLSFTEPVMIKMIQFRNYYTAYLKLLCKRVPGEKDVKNRDILPWQVSIKQLFLMQDPHTEEHSQDNISISAKESSIPWTGVVHLRIILKQPSFQWKKFGIKDLTIFKATPQQDGKQAGLNLSASALRKSDQKVSLIKQEKTENKSISVRNLMAISELMKDKQYIGTSVGRYEVEGSYDITHLV